MTFICDNMSFIVKKENKLLQMTCILLQMKDMLQEMRYPTGWSVRDQSHPANKDLKR
jgi:hypothetical protein